MILDVHTLFPYTLSFSLLPRRIFSLTHTQTHTYTNTHIHKHTHTQTQTYIHTRTYTYTYTYTHTHTHTHTHTNSLYFCRFDSLARSLYSSIVLYVLCKDIPVLSPTKYWYWGDEASCWTTAEGLISLLPARRTAAFSGPHAMSCATLSCTVE